MFLTRAERRAFAGPADFLLDPGHRAEIGVYLSDMVRPYGLTLHAGLFSDEMSGDPGHSYGEMAEAMIGAVVAPDEPVDLLILAFASHDVRPGRATATYLSHVCPGNPLAFAVCDQGSAAAFTGLRLVRDYLGCGVGSGSGGVGSGSGGVGSGSGGVGSGSGGVGGGSGGVRRALLLVLEQATLPYDTPPAAPVPSGHTGVVLRFERADRGVDEQQPAATGSPRLRTVRLHPNVGPDMESLTALVVGALSTGTMPTSAMPASAMPTGAGTLLLVNAALGAIIGTTALATTVPATTGPAPTVPAATVRVAPAGRPFTGVWWDLAGAICEPAGPSQVLLADYDPGLRYLSLAAIDRD